MSGLLRCPTCGEWLGTCGHAVETHDGVPDLAPHLAIADPAFGREQRVMNTRLFARIYETWIWRPFHGYVASRGTLGQEIDTVLGLAGAGVRTAIDVACGTGLYTRAMARRWPNAEVVGVDLSISMLSRARKLATEQGLAHVPFVRGDIHRLPLADASVGHVNCAAALHLFPDRPAIWREIARVLAPGGVFTAMTVGRRPLGRWSLQAVLERHVSFQFFDPEELVGDLTRAGFRDVRTHMQHAALMFAAVRA